MQSIRLKTAALNKCCTCTLIQFRNIFNSVSASRYRLLHLSYLTVSALKEVKLVGIWCLKCSRLLSTKCEASLTLRDFCRSAEDGMPFSVRSSTDRQASLPELHSPLQQCTINPMCVQICSANCMRRHCSKNVARFSIPKQKTMTSPSFQKLKISRFEGENKALQLLAWIKIDGCLHPAH